MTLSEYNFILMLVGFAFNALWGVAWWFFRGYLAAFRECLRHIEDAQRAQSAALEAWKLESTSAHLTLGSQIGLLSGKVETIATQSRDQSVDIKAMSPRLAVLEFRLRGVRDAD